MLIPCRVVRDGSYDKAISMINKSNIYLFHGDDDFSIKRKVDFWKAEFAKKYSQSSVVVLDGQEADRSALIRKIDEALAPSLFSDKKLIVCRNCFPTKAGEEALAASISKLITSLPAGYFLVFEQTTRPDKRLASIKKILSHPMEISELKLPHGQQLQSWITQELKKDQAAIEEKALELLAVYLGRDLFEEKKIGGRVIETKEVFDLWQVHNELEKLVSRTKHIQVADVQALVRPKLPENIFELSDQIISGHKQQAFQTLENLMAGNPGDEKSEIIRIVALLAEQFRSLATVSSLADKKNQQEIAEMLGWSPGRVFVNLKLAKSIRFEKLKIYLGGLLSIDKSLKTSDSNPRLLLSMFLQGS